MLHLQLPEGSTTPMMEQASQSSLTAAKQHIDKTDLAEAKKLTKEPTSTKDKSESAAAAGPEMDRELIEKKYPIGTMIWGKLPGYDWWPGVLLSYSDGTSGGAKKDASTEEQQLSDDEDSSSNVVRVWVKWYGDNQLSQVSVLTYFNFSCLRLHL